MVRGTRDVLERFENLNGLDVLKEKRSLGGLVAFPPVAFTLSVARARPPTRTFSVALPLPVTLAVSIPVTVSPSVLGLSTFTVSTIIQTVEFAVPVTVFVFV